MGGQNRLSYQLVKVLQCSHAEAAGLCIQGKVKIDGVLLSNPRDTISENAEISIDDQIIRYKRDFKYVLFHKPMGFECTANRKIIDNIYHLLPEEFQDLFPLGRLDKNSQGLLLLTNDGSIYNEMVGGGTVEKEYRVTTHRPVDEQLATAFTNPFQLGHRFTLPAKFIFISEYEFSVTLTEGLNRQIRRICAKNNNQVKELIRVRFGAEHLNEIPVGEWKVVSKFRI